MTTVTLDLVSLHCHTPEDKSAMIWIGKSISYSDFRVNIEIRMRRRLCASVRAPGRSLLPGPSRWHSVRFQV